MTSNKPAKTNLNEIVAGQPAAPTPAAKPQSIKKEATPSQVKQGEAKPSSYSSGVADRIKAAAARRAQADAAAIRTYGQKVYERELALEIQRLMGADADAYFRFEIENLSLPGTADAGYLQTIEVAALPSSN